MTVIPFPSILPTPPSGLGTATGSTASADPAAAGFAALVASLVAGQFPGGATAMPGVTPPAGEAGQDPDATLPEDEASGDGAAVAALPVPGLVALIGVVPPAPTGTSIPSGEPAGVAATAVAPTGQAPTTALTVVPAWDAAAGEATAPVAATAASTEVAASTPETAPSAAATGPSANTPAGATPLASAPAGTADASPVTRQVFPEVTRLVTAGNGTHRVTLSLQPEQLGEVRVTLTVRDGEVVVRMAAGDDAQRALLEGAPELRRILELTGATDTRIVVRDLPGTTAPPQPNASPAAGEGRDGSGLAGQAGDRTHDQHAGTRGGSTARDGSTQGAGDGPTGGATPPAPGRPVTGTRTAGLDVTI